MNLAVDLEKFSIFEMNPWAVAGILILLWVVATAIFRFKDR